MKISALFMCFFVCTFSIFATTIDTRLNTMITDQINYPYPDPDHQDEYYKCYGRTVYALAALHQGTDITTANNYLQWIHDYYNIPEDSSYEYTVYWIQSMLWRIYHHENCAQNSTSQTRANLEDMMWRYINTRSLVSKANDTIRKVYSSENHEMIYKSCSLLGCEGLIDGGWSSSTQLADGYTLAQHRQAWTNHLKEYFRFRAREGLLLEMASPGYNQVTLHCWYNIRDFANDDELRNLADKAITLFWADTAQDHLVAQGIRGGAMTRCYKDYNLTRASAIDLRKILWAYDWHDTDPGRCSSPKDIIVATSDYRVPDIVWACGSESSKPPYMTSTRRFGMGTETGSGSTLVYTLNFDSGNASNILRNTWLTSDYVMGTMTFDGSKTYTRLLTQNRAMGVFFAGSLNDRIVIHGKGTTDSGRTGYEEITGYCGPDVMIVARDTGAAYSDGTRIFISSGDAWNHKIDDSGWIFTYINNACVAIRIGTGGYTTTAVTDGVMIELGDMWSPIVIQTAQFAGNYTDFTDFKNSVKANYFDYSNSKLTYISENYDKYEIWRNSNTIPQMNDQTIELNPCFVYSSPYIFAYHGQEKITISYPGYQAEILDFSYWDCPQRDDYQTKALWHMDSLVSGKVPDADIEIINRNKDLTLSGATLTTNGGGKYGEALNFDGIDDQAYYNSLWQSTFKAVKVDMWIKADRNNVNLQVLAEANSTWSIFLSNSDLRFTVYTAPGVTRNLTLPGRISVGTWYHVTVYIDEDGYMELKCNDDQTSSTGDAMLLQTVNVYLGNKQNTTRWFDGCIDEVKISTPEINLPDGTIYVLEDDVPTIGLWHMDSISNNKVYDDDSVVVDRNNDLTIYGSTTATGLINNALNFDGTDDYAVTSSTWSSYDSLLVDFWFNTDRNDISPQVMVTARNIWDINISYDDIVFNMSTTAGIRTLTIPNIVETGRWYHVRGSFNTMGKMQLDVDGQSVESAGATMTISNQSINLGNKSGYSRYFDGLLDEVRISTPN